jgi:DNA-binding transcriptional ArsR family regulator
MPLPLHDDADHTAHLADVLRALGHPLRLRIVSMLADRDTHVSALAGRLAAPQAIVSQQLRILRMAGLVEVTRRNGHATYRLAEPQLRDLLACLGHCSRTVRVARLQALEGVE